jgi:hypothetical protein
MWFLKGFGSNCVMQEERDIDWWGVPLFHIVCKEVELKEEVEWWTLSSSIFPQPSWWCWKVGVREVWS